MKDRDVINEFIYLLQQPGEWECNEYYLRHKPTGLSFWIANGWSFLDTKPAESGLRWRDRWRLWPHVRRCIQLIPLAKAAGPEGA